MPFVSLFAETRGEAGRSETAQALITTGVLALVVTAVYAAVLSRRPHWLPDQFRQWRQFQLACSVVLMAGSVVMVGAGIYKALA